MRIILFYWQIIGKQYNKMSMFKRFLAERKLELYTKKTKLLVNSRKGKEKKEV